MSDVTSSEISPEISPEVSPEEIVSTSPLREAPTLRKEAWMQIQEQFVDRGQVVMPCVPTMLNNCLDRILRIFQSIDANVDSNAVSEIARNLASKLQEGLDISISSHVRFKYELTAPRSENLRFEFNLEVTTMEQQYQHWLATREPPLFGNYPDAKLIGVAASLGEPSQVPVLDVGAGTGRNTIALAQLGYPVDAVELTPEFVEQMRSNAEESGLAVRIFPGDILKPKEVKLRPAHYRLVVLAEVIASHFKDVDQLRLLLAKMSDTLRSGGLLLFSIFLAVDDYEPDDLARQLSHMNWCCLFTRQDLAIAMEKLPLELVSDESVQEYEKKHQPMEAWPPTGWFVKWCEGRNLFIITDEESKPPMELRWILCRRL